MNAICGGLVNELYSLVHTSVKVMPDRFGLDGSDSDGLFISGGGVHVYGQHLASVVLLKLLTIAVILLDSQLLLIAVDGPLSYLPRSHLVSFNDSVNKHALKYRPKASGSQQIGRAGSYS